jgi:hypothetical protein
MLRCMASSATPRLFFTRGLVAIAWAVVFAIAAHSLTTGVGVLLVLYPLIDVVGSVIDARGQQGSARQVLEFNAAVSAGAAVALGIAATGDKGNVLAVFGVWALFAGGAQIVVPSVGARSSGSNGRCCSLVPGPRSGASRSS